MEDIILVIILQIIVTESCQYDSSLDGTTWLRGYQSVPSHPDHSQPVHQPPGHHTPPYIYDVFTRGNVNTFTSSNHTHPTEQWECVEMRKEMIGTTSHYFCVLVHHTSRRYQCRQYTPIPPSVMLLRQHIYGGGQPGLDVCIELLQHADLVNILVIYNRDLVAGAPCPWTPGNYSMSVQFQDNDYRSPRRCTGEATLLGARFSSKGCGGIDTFSHPFNSKLFCVASWVGERLSAMPAISDRHTLMYRYDLHSSKYHFYVIRYTLELGGHLKMSLKSSPDPKVTFRLYTPLVTVSPRHSYLLLTLLTAVGMTHRQEPSPTPAFTHTTTVPHLGPAGGLPPAGATDSYKVTYRPTRPHTTQGHLTSCRTTPCLNGGKCRPHHNTCFCPPGTAGPQCEKEANTSTKSMDMVPPVVTASTPVDFSQTMRQSPGSHGAGNGGRPGPLGTTMTLKEAEATTPSLQGAAAATGGVAVGWSEQQDHTLLVCLVTLSVGFTVLSILLCFVACCRRPPPPLLDDRKQLLAAESTYVTSGVEVVPPYGKPTGQAWFPDYRRGGASMGAAASVEKEFLPEEKKSAEKLSRLAGK